LDSVVVAVAGTFLVTGREAETETERPDPVPSAVVGVEASVA
jgi:hypothetical protein